MGYELVGVGFAVVGVADGFGVGLGVFEALGVAEGVGTGLLSASQLTTSIWRSAFDVSNTQRWAALSSRVLTTSAPDPSVAAGVSARSWSQRGTRVPCRVKS